MTLPPKLKSRCEELAEKYCDSEQSFIDGRSNVTEFRRFKRGFESCYQELRPVLESIGYNLEICKVVTENATDREILVAFGCVRLNMEEALQKLTELVGE